MSLFENSTISKQNLARSPNNKEALQRFLSDKKKYKSCLKKAEKVID